MDLKNVAVVGAGIIGLSTALEIQKRITDTKVTLIADKFTPNTTADGAAGIFGLYLLGDKNPEQQVRWAQATHDLLESWWKSQDAAKLGVSLISLRRLNFPQVHPIWKDVVFGLREMSQEELNDIGRLSGKHESGLEMVTFTAEPLRFMPHLLKDFKERGGRVYKTKVNDLNLLLSKYDCVVNCTGVWAGQLTGDKSIKPLRGQVMRVEAPWLKTVILDDKDDGNYVIVNQESVVVGGTHQAGDWDLNPREEDKVFIREGGRCLEPSLAQAKELNHWVGLRPSRPCVRLEREGKIVHNYGHGGSGITVFQGCAEEAAKLVAEALEEQDLNRSCRENSKSKL